MVAERDNRHREFSGAIVIDTRGCILLHQRDNVPGITCPGMIGLFGGHRETGETFLQCVVREVHEELSYFVPPEQFLFLSSYRGEDIDRNNGGTVCAQYFVTRGIPLDAIVVTEGSMHVARLSDVPALMERVVPSARSVLLKFIGAGEAFAKPQGC